MTSAGGGDVFVSYRRQESSHLAGRLYDRLADRFGEDRVFIDVDAIEPGLDFAEEIFRAVAACQVLLAIIGPGWLTATDERGGRRLDDPDDIVRLEIEAALTRGVRVIPVLVEGTIMPTRHELPESLTGLARRNAFRIRHDSFRSDAGRLVTAVERILVPAPGTAAPTAPDAYNVRSAGNAPSEVAQQDSEPARTDPGSPGSRLMDLLQSALTSACAALVGNEIEDQYSADEFRSGLDFSEVSLPRGLETATIENVDPDVSTAHWKAYDTLEDSTLLVKVYVDAAVTVEGFMAHADYYAHYEDVQAYDADWNEHYAWVFLERDVRLCFNTAIGSNPEKVDDLEFDSASELPATANS